MHFSENVVHNKINSNSYETSHACLTSSGRLLHLYFEENVIFRVYANHICYVVVIIVTDGNSNINTVDTIPEAIQLREAGVYIFVIAINYSGDMYRQEVDEIASQPPHQNVFWVNDFSDLEGVAGALFNKMSSPGIP